MNGYFQRLMARSAGAGAGIHPLSRLPHAGLREAAPLDGSGDFTDTLQTSERLQTITEQHGAAAKIPASHPEAPTTLLRAPVPQTSNAKATENPAAAPAHPVPSPSQPPTLEKGNIPARRMAPTMSVAQAVELEPPLPVTPVAQAVEPEQPPARAAERFANKVSDTPEAFRLMAPAPRDLAHDAVSSAPALSFWPEAGAGRVQAANLALQARPSMRSQKAEPGKTEATEVHVSIGRIEITAVQAPAPPNRKPVAGRKPLSLDDYLARRGRA